MPRCRPELALICLAALAQPAHADPQSLSTDVPVPVQDALVVKTGTLELQGVGVFTRDDFNSKGPNLLSLSPTIKLGAARHLQLDLSAPYAVGNQSSASQGQGSADFVYQFTDPSPHFPALAVQAGWQYAEYGPGHQSNQYFVRALATQWVGSSDKSPRLHLNLNWTHVDEPSRTQRSDIAEIGLAWSQLVSSHTALVVDVMHGAKSATGQVETMVDAGLRHEIDAHWTISGGVGGGMFQQSPDFRVLFAIQRGFALF
jgi:hypothetical protein